MKNIKKLMLLTALCAIISCEGGGGTSAANGGTSASNGPTPSVPSKPTELKPVDNNPVPSEPNKPIELKPVDNEPIPINPNKPIELKPVNKRYTEIDFSKMNYNNTNYKFKPAKNINEVEKGEYGSSYIYNHILGKFYGSYDYIKNNKIIIKNGGIGIDAYYDYFGGTSDFTFSVIPGSIIQHINKLNENNNSIEVEEGGTYFIFNNVYLSLKDSPIKAILNSLKERFPTYYTSIINSGLEKLIKFKNSQILINEDVSDSTPDNNEYFKLMKLMINPRFGVEENASIQMNGNNLIGVRAIGGRYYNGFIISEGGKKHPDVDGVFRWSYNEGKIQMLGDNSIAVFLKGVVGFRNGNFTINNGAIGVNKNSVGIYAVYEDEDFEDIYLNLKMGNLRPEIYNNGYIVIGKNSTGMYLYTKYYNTKLEFSNYDLRSSIQSGEENATGMAFNIGGDRATVEENDTDYIIYGSNRGEIKLLGNRSTGMYLTGNGRAFIINENKITLVNSKDKTDPGIGMYSNNPNGIIRNHNNGKIYIGTNAIGMAGINQTTVENNGEIIIEGNDSIGMYLSDGAIGVNNGVIRTENKNYPERVIGVFVGTGAVFSNNGKVSINSKDGALFVKAGGVIKNYGDMEIGIGTSIERIGEPILHFLSNRSMPVKKDLGVYVDSLGETNPIKGLANLGLKNAELLIGAEATEKTNATEVTVAGNVLDPFNKSIHESNIGSWSVGSGSLVWEAEPEIKDNNIEKVTLKKQSYAKYANSEETKAVAEALDEKYVNTMAESKDKQIFNDMNKLRTEKELAKTYKEVSGGQYINVQQRINQTDEVLEKEITALRNDNLTEAGHHITTFVGKDNYEAKTPEIAKSSSVNYGAAYLYNDTNNGWGAYAGAVMNKFKLEDEGKSKENMTLVKAGAYKTFDLGPVDWTVGGEGNISWNEMKRRYVSAETVYENKADYNSYGLAVKNELSKTYQLNDMFTFKPYGALKLGFGKFTDIKEKNSTLGLEIKGNSYYSVKPALGMELGLSVPVGTTAKFKAGLGLAYEHELGKIENNENEAKFISAGSSWKLKGAKDEDRGGLKSELKAGFEAGNYNMYLTGGYNTKGKNSHVGIKFGASF